MGGQLKTPGIIYLHGFASSPASWKARLLAEAMAKRGLADNFACPQLSPVPDEAVATLSRLIEATGGRVTLVGSSLGGHYASHLAEKHGLKAVLINPAAVDRLDLAAFVGEHVHHHSGEAFSFSAAHAAQLKAQVARPTPTRYWLLLEEGDAVLDYRQARDFYAACRQTVLPGGDHGFTKFPDFIPQIIEFAGL
ncbi:MAG: YqiA/YcfP family alpha/beta fold hydrolase [Bacteroidota bacterium]